MKKQRIRQLASNAILGLAFSTVWAGFFVYALIK